MLLVLHGAKRNAGDFLIRDRGVALLRHLRPEHELVVRPRWLPITPSLLEAADAVVLCGGPGLAANFYPDLFPLVPRLDKVDKPILPLALGWSGSPARCTGEFRFSASSIEALQAIHRRIGWSGVRDELSLRLLNAAGFDAVRCTGCVAWYHLASLGRPFVPPRTVRSLVFTPPGNLRHMWEAVDLLRRLAARYPAARRYCVFHRGLRWDRRAKARAVLGSRMIEFAARAHGYTVVDASYGAEKLSLYRDVDLHVGYRVHAHLCFLSLRRASLLVSEDGRGEGQALTLGDPYRLIAGSESLVQRTLAAVTAEEANGFDSVAEAIGHIDRTWPTMEATVQQLPC